MTEPPLRLQHASPDRFIPEHIRIRRTEMRSRYRLAHLRRPASKARCSGCSDKAGDEPGGARYTRRRARLDSRVSGARLPKEQSMVLDVTLLAVMLISALLAMVRGFMREVLSIASWLAAAVAALYFHKRLIPVVKEYITTNDTVALAISVGRNILHHLARRRRDHDQDFRHRARQPDRRARPDAGISVRPGSRPGHHGGGVRIRHLAGARESAAEMDQRGEVAG